MLTELLLAADPPNAPTTIDLNAALLGVKGLLLGGILVLLVWITIKALYKNHDQGDSSGAISMVKNVIICLMPLGFAISIAVLMGYGTAMVNLLTSVVSPK